MSKSVASVLSRPAVFNPVAVPVAAAVARTVVKPAAARRRTPDVATSTTGAAATPVVEEALSRLLDLVPVRT